MLRSTVGEAGSAGRRTRRVARMFLMMAAMASDSVDLLPYCASTAPRMGERSLSTELGVRANAAWRISTAAL